MKFISSGKLKLVRNTLILYKTNRILNNQLYYMSAATPKILFTPDALPFILKAFNKSINEDQLIVDENGEPVLTPEGEIIHASKFGGLKKGSEIFIKDDLYSIMNLSEGKY